MLTKIKIGVLREGIQQASHTLDSKASSIGSWLYLIARQTKGANGGDPGRLYLYSSNLGLSRMLLKIPAEVTKEGEAIVPPKLLQSILNGLPDDEDIELTLSASGSKLQAKYASIKSEVAVHADAPKAAEVLKTIPFNAEPNVTISAATLVECINRTLFCTASNDGAISEGPWLSSVRLETSDGSVMAIATNRIIAGQAEVLDGSAKSGYSSGVHRDALLALKALLSKRKEEEVTITNVQTQSGQSNETLFRFSDVILGVRQLSKPYPLAVGKVFTTPESFRSAIINRKVLLGVFSRLSAFAEKSSFTIAFTGDKVTLETRGFNSIFQEQVASVGDAGTVVKVGLSIADVFNVLTAMQSEEVVAKFHTAADHVHLQEGDSNFKYVLSPVQINWGTKEKK